MAAPASYNSKQTANASVGASTPAAATARFSDTQGPGHRRSVEQRPRVSAQPTRNAAVGASTPVVVNHAYHNDVLYPFDVAAVGASTPAATPTQVEGPPSSSGRRDTGTSRPSIPRHSQYLNEEVASPTYVGASHAPRVGSGQDRSGALGDPPRDSRLVVNFAGIS